MVGQIRYGDDEKKKPDATLPGPAITGGWGAAPPPPRSAAVAPPQAPPVTVTPPTGTERLLPSHEQRPTLPMPPAGGAAVSELRPPIPQRGGYASFGPSMSPANVGAAERATNSLLNQPYGASKAFGGRSIEQLITEVANKFGGMENLRSRSTGRALDTQESSSRPYTGAYLEGLLQRGPSNRLENILLRRYYGNVGQQNRAQATRMDNQDTVGVSAAPDMLRDIMNAANEAERIGVTGQTQALDTVMTGRAHAASNATSGFNQALQSGTQLAATEIDATARLFGDTSVAGGGRMQAWERFVAQNPDVVMDPDTGLPDPAKVEAVRRSMPEATLPPGGGAAARGGAAQRGGTAAPPSLPQSYIADLQQKGWRYAGLRTNPKGQPVHVFTKPGQSPFEVPVK
jgi:hypothetical protein